MITALILSALIYGIVSLVYFIQIVKTDLNNGCTTKGFIPKMLVGAFGFSIGATVAGVFTLALLSRG